MPQNVQTNANSDGMKTVAELMLEQLRSWGVKRMYGVIGDAILGLTDALAKQDEIQFIAVKHESAAAMMASAEAKLTGNLGVCVSTMGPGLANLLNGLGDAYLDKAPVLAISGQAPTNKIGTDYKQYVDQQELIKPFASYSTLLASPEAAIEVLAKAMHMSLSIGVVTHLSVPKDIFDMKIELQIRQKPVVLQGTTTFQEEDLRQALAIMRTARRPMIVAGVGARSAASSVEELAEKWGAGLLLSLGAKGMLPETSPHVLGGIGQGGNPYAPEVFEKADVVLLVGDTWWPEGYVPKNTHVIQIDFMRQNIGKGIPVELGIVGDSASVVPLLVRGLEKESIDSDWLASWQEARRRWLEENEQEGTRSGSPLHPSRIARAIERTVQPDTVLTIDTGDVTVWMNRNFRPQQQEMLFSGDWRTMGFGLPAAIAAKLSAPDKQVVAVVGDGGLEMVLADLLTAKRYELDITVIVFNNGMLQMERDKMIVGDYRQLGVELTNPDFVRLAEACGWTGYRIESDEQLEETLQRAFSSDGPVLVDVNTAPIVHPETKG
jgi:pyruvate oxidase